MRKSLQITLGLITSIGGFLEIGSVTTAAQAGATFGFRLLWAVVAGTIALACLCEMAGRLALASGETIVDAIRSRFGFRFYALVLLGVTVISLLVLVAEVGGVALALQQLTGIGVRVLAIPIVVVAWMFLWKGRLGAIENGTSILGLLTLAFVVALWRMHPSPAALLKGLVPSAPSRGGAHYWFLAVSIVGASVSPYLVFFYSAGAVEDRWDDTFLLTNRIIAGAGTLFGGVLAMVVLALGATALRPHGIDASTFAETTHLLVDAMPRWGPTVFALAMLITCMGAALEIALSIAYLLAQGLGWNWSENDPAAGDARFSVTYTLVLAAAALPIVAGVDAIKLTMISMALTAATLPISTVPFVFLMNDRVFCGEHRNGWISNTAVLVIVLASGILALVAIPLQITGGG